MTLLGNNMNNLRIIFLAAAMMPFIVQCMDDPQPSDKIDWLADYFGLPRDCQSTVSFKPSISNFILDYSFYLGLDSWAHTPELAWLENEQIRQYFLNKEQLGNTCSSTETTSSTNDGENNEKKYVFEPIVGSSNHGWEFPSEFSSLEVSRARELSPAMQALDRRIEDLPTDIRLQALRAFEVGMTVDEANALADYYIDLANKRKDEKGQNE